MKNIVLIDFSPESIKALEYAVQFVKNIDKASLELVNVSLKNEDSSSDSEKSNTKKLNELKIKYTSSELTIQTKELEGELLDVLPGYLDENSVGFVFGGTHDLTFLERLLTSRTFKLMKNTHVNFVFVPESVAKAKPIGHVMLPILSDKQSLQNLEPLLFLRHFNEFKITLCSYNETSDGQDHNLYVASKIMNRANVPFDIQYLGTNENELLNGLEDYAETIGVDTISIVDFTDDSIFNFGMTGFIENLIRNDHGISVIAVQNVELPHYSSFRVTGG